MTDSSMRYQEASVRLRGAYRSWKKMPVNDQVVELRRRADTGEPKAGLAHEFGISSRPFINT
jgi:hypothetical protein